MNARYVFAGTALLLIALIFFLPPLARILNHTAVRMRSFASALLYAQEREREVASLQDQIAFLGKRLLNLNRLQKEEALSQVNQYAPLKSNEKILAASVIGKGIFLGSQALMLDKGSQGGIKEGDSVVVLREEVIYQSQKGFILVGRVAKVLSNRSYVLLVNDASFQIPGKILQGNARGIVRGGPGNQVTFGKIVQGVPLAKGEPIITDNDDPQIPTGILIGTIGSILSRPTDVVQETSVVIYFDPIQLDVVGVIQVNQ